MEIERGRIMSREIKFRAWNIHNEQMCEVSHINLKGKSGVMSCAKYTSSFVFDEVILEQFTGLQDTNGVEIYEGDILELYKNKQRYVESVKYNETNRQFEAVVDDFGVYDLMRFYTIKVIGNIHENPELLEVQE